jgi:hypothetical protein
MPTVGLQAVAVDPQLLVEPGFEGFGIDVACELTHRDQQRGVARDADLTVDDNSKFLCQLAGHVEDGNDSWSDPAMGGVAVKDDD